jgi:hypothetical protein
MKRKRDSGGSHNTYVGRTITLVTIYQLRESGYFATWGEQMCRPVLHILWYRLVRIRLVVNGEATEAAFGHKWT